MILTDKNMLQLIILIAAIAVLCILYLAFSYYREQKKVLKILEILIGIVEAGDANLHGHSLHVHNLVMVMYEFMPYKYRLCVKQKDLGYASLLLDIGKLAIPSDIMKRAGKLENDEWDIVRKHPEIGIGMLKSVPGFDTVCKYILYHHERIDGKGYHQLTRDQIPLGSKIIAVADTYSAITMNRSYRPSLPYAEAISELRMAAGKQLDEELVNIFCNIPMSKIDSCLEDVRNKMERYTYDRKGNM